FPEEHLGVRIEDDVLITEAGYKLLTARLPRTIIEIEKIMAEAAENNRRVSGMAGGSRERSRRDSSVRRDPVSDDAGPAQQPQRRLLPVPASSQLNWLPNTSKSRPSPSQAMSSAPIFRSQSSLPSSEAYTRSRALPGHRVERNNTARREPSGASASLVHRSAESSASERLRSTLPVAAS